MPRNSSTQPHRVIIRWQKVANMPTHNSRQKKSEALNILFKKIQQTELTTESPVSVFGIQVLLYPEQITRKIMVMV